MRFIVHAVMPSPGASLDVYFIILYLHILCVVHCFGLRSMLCRKEVGLRFGLAFALLYMIGMQEVVVSASPFDTYGMDFIFYQLFMGLILEGMMFKMFLRSGVDVIVIFIAIWFLEHKYMMLQKE